MFEAFLIGLLSGTFHTLNMGCIVELNSSVEYVTFMFYGHTFMVHKWDTLIKGLCVIFRVNCSWSCDITMHLSCFWPHWQIGA
jgi:hypothetical protein